MPDVSLYDDKVRNKIFSLIESYNGYWFWLGKRFPLTTNTDLNKDFRMAPEDAAELLESFAEMFAIAPETIDFGKYFPADFSDADAPLTIQLLIDSASAGVWLG